MDTKRPPGEPVRKFVCGSQPEIRDGSDQIERASTRAKEEQKPDLDPAIIDELMKGYQRPEDMTGPGGILERLIKRVYERILGAELTHYLGYEKGQAGQRATKISMIMTICGLIPSMGCSPARAIHSEKIGS
jgi:hypothetical protein